MAMNGFSNKSGMKSLKILKGWDHLFHTVSGAKHEIANEGSIIFNRIASGLWAGSHKPSALSSGKSAAAASTASSVSAG